MNIRRNAPCPCGSGEKFKHCCGAFTNPKGTLDFGRQPQQTRQDFAREMLRRRRAEESIRQQQQGYGKSIISMFHQGNRFVAVGSKVFWNQNWRVFPDFLFHFLKETLGLEWGARAQKAKSPHPIFRWLAKIDGQTAKHTTAEGHIEARPLVGFVSCTLHLAYALYSIAHNDKIPNRLLRRLRDPMTSMPAYYEALVGAALAVAGFEITNAETRATSTPTPEFRARSKSSGKIYEVEARAVSCLSESKGIPESAEV